MTTISPEIVRATPGEPAEAHFSVSTTDRLISPEVKHTVGAVVAAYLRSGWKLRVIGTTRLSREEALMAEGYREMADEMLALARDARAAQLRALPLE